LLLDLLPVLAGFVPLPAGDLDLLEQFRPIAIRALPLGLFESLGHLVALAFRLFDALRHLQALAFGEFNPFGHLVALLLHPLEVLRHLVALELEAFEVLGHLIAVLLHTLEMLGHFAPLLLGLFNPLLHLAGLAVVGRVGHERVRSDVEVFFGVLRLDERLGLEDRLGPKDRLGSFGGESAILAERTLRTRPAGNADQTHRSDRGNQKRPHANHDSTPLELGKDFGNPV
jgi:hypothetical protein